MRKSSEFKFIALLWLAIALIWGSFEGYFYFKIKDEIEYVNNDVQQILTLPNIKHEDNAFFLAEGLIISKNQDSEKFGLKLLQGYESQFTDPDDYAWHNKHIPDLFYTTDNLIYFKYDHALDVYCPLFQPHRSKKDNNCATHEQMLRIAQDNAFMIDRYTKRFEKLHFYEYPRFRQVFNTSYHAEMSGSLYNGMMIELAKQGRFEDALNGWIKHREYLSRAVSGHQRRRIKNNHAKYARFADETLPVVLQHIPNDVIRRYKSKLIEALNRDTYGPNGLNLEAMFVADYYFSANKYASPDNMSWASVWFQYKEHERKKSWLEFRREILNMVSIKDPYKRYSEGQRIWSKWSVKEEGIALLPTIIFDYGRYFIDAYYIDFKFWEFDRDRLIHKSYMNMLKLYIEARSEDIPPDQMEAFMKRYNDVYYDELVNKPYQWDPSMRAITLTLNPKTNLKRQIVYP